MGVYYIGSYWISCHDRTMFDLGQVCVVVAAQTLIVSHGPE